MGKKVNKTLRGTTIQASVYVPLEVYTFFEANFKQNGYSSIADYMRGVLREHFLANRVDLNITNIEGF